MLKDLQSQPDSPELRLHLARARLAYQVLSRRESRAAYHQQLEMSGPRQRRWEAPQEDRMHPALYIGLFTFLLGLPGLVFTGLYAFFTRKHRAAN
jgi:hypothetical protein